MGRMSSGPKAWPRMYVVTLKEGSRGRGWLSVDIEDWMAGMKIVDAKELVDVSLCVEFVSCCGLTRGNTSRTNTRS